MPIMTSSPTSPLVTHVEGFAWDRPLVLTLVTRVEGFYRRKS